MRTLMTIGEAAGLVGITPKAVKNYHRLGLLAEPPRSAAGYRLYAAADLVRMRRIRRLHELGLPLRRIHGLLDPERGDESVGAALATRRAELTAEIARLERRERAIGMALARQDLDHAGPPDAPSPTFGRIAAVLGAETSVVAPAALALEERAWAAIDAFAWPPSIAAARDVVEQHYTRCPDDYRELLEWIAPVASMEPKSNGPPGIEALAEEVAVRFRRLAPPPVLPAAAGWPHGALWDVFAEAVVAELSPAQRRVLDTIRLLLAAADDGVATGADHGRRQ